ncbi:NAD(P)H-binding protein [Streptomyces sp. MJP52]|uniref:NAD(P)H-binding protein n=1 Tax=Streptomyces sp. MJP52 TaxID=2940555 RepID=UPI00247438E9|nr:NAD(P)H-binding protein [Streptomyces sp. MJP52]MDH6225926.1 NAD(P)H dehydrogenase (quinone) [Streptomyces sp. MJP52]
MRMVVTGAAGSLGTRVIEELLERVPADGVVAVVPSGRHGAAFAARGVRLAVADHDVPESLVGVFRPGDRVLLVPGDGPAADRAAQHRPVVEAADAAGAALLAYVSVPGALRARAADVHRRTEGLVLASGLPYTLLRTNWCTELYTGRLPLVLHLGAVTQAAGDGRIASASRADYAAAAATVLTGVGGGHENRTYELGGDTAWSLSEYAAEISRRAGREIPYRAVSYDAYLDSLTSAGLPGPAAELVAGVDASIARGELSGVNGQLSRLIGRPTTPMPWSVAEAMRGLAGAG